MKALILAAGYATRLYPLTKTFPKPLLSIANRPILDHIMEKLSKLKEIGEVIIITNERFSSNFSDWLDKLKENNARHPKVLSDGTKTESDKLGAIGDINFTLDKEDIREDTLILGGDNLFEENLDGFMEFALSRKPSASIGIYDIKDKSLANKYGVVKLDSDSRIIDFVEKPKIPESSLVATCLYYIAARKLKYFKEYLSDPKRESDSVGSFIGWLAKKEDVYGYVFRKQWYDIGDANMYKKADRAFSMSCKHQA